MIATIGIITALRAGGAFSNTEQCMGMIDSTIGKEVAKALINSGAANTQLFSPVKSQLQALASGNSSVSFTGLASQSPLLQQLLSYMTCGCQAGQVPNPARTACVRIGRTPAGGGVITKRPRGPVAPPDRRRPPPGVFKPPNGLPIPR